MSGYEHVIHPFLPVYDQDSEVLILGTLPSVKSRETDFYYGHKQNRFWKILAAIFAEPLPVAVEEKRSLLLRNHIALWDVIESCDIIGSRDGSIKNVVPWDIKSLIDKTGIKAVYTNGGLAKKLYDKYALPYTGMEAIKLPSTSPANARVSFEDLMAEWERALMPNLSLWNEKEKL